ncbi:hypothetical protein BDB00DRAFT_765912 [Zychaea mexicana]|uniref:uncharacterized protein n=1 Tax=Zychaea mexicana TaxID=64656 RepID=UPI0022FE269E|nr:uncharacterized protein BDB00DRAFT_765912 [Zychaea mexicana]KAI9492224.1 hypothetical protein BDB00DRAFT_765912 [Zychaea mexicana]
MKCCFCINLRTATLFLAVLGTITHLYGAFALTALSDEFDDGDSGTVFGLTMYSYLSGVACLAGAVGVIKHNAKHLRLFSAFYWVDLALHMVFSVASAFLFFSMHSEVCQQVVQEAPKDEHIDMETCETAYIGSAWVITIAMAVNLLLKLHFAFAIHSYMLQVKQEQQEESFAQEAVVVGYPAAAPPVYNDVEKETVFVAGQEFVPNEKK